MRYMLVLSACLPSGSHFEKLKLKSSVSVLCVFFCFLTRSSFFPPTPDPPLSARSTSTPACDPTQHNTNTPYPSHPIPTRPPVVHAVHPPFRAPAEGLGGHPGDLRARLLRGGGPPEALRRAAAADGRGRRRGQLGHSAARRWERRFGFRHGRSGDWECWRSAERHE